MKIITDTETDTDNGFSLSADPIDRQILKISTDTDIVSVVHYHGVSLFVVTFFCLK